MNFFCDRYDNNIIHKITKLEKKSNKDFEFSWKNKQWNAKFKNIFKTRKKRILLRKKTIEKRGH